MISPIFYYSLKIILLRTMIRMELNQRILSPQETSNYTTTLSQVILYRVNHNSFESEIIWTWDNFFSNHAQNKNNQKR